MGELILWTGILAGIPLALGFVKIGFRRLGEAIRSRVFGSVERVPPAACTVVEAIENRRITDSSAAPGSDRIADHCSEPVGSAS
jgi:hypothetical protein